MALTITHSTVVVVADDGTSPVGTDEWNANHTLTGSIAVSELTGAGTGILTALAINVGSAGAPVLFNGAGGTPSSLTLTNATGLPAVGGGTGQSTYTKGDLLASPGSNTLNKLAIGTDAFVLTADAASTNGMKWAAASGGGLTIGTTTITSGTTTRLLYDLGGVVQEAAGVTVDATSNGLVLTGTSTGAASLLTLTGQTGVLAASQPIINATQTWNAAGVTFTALKLNVTNTASASGSLLQDWQIGGVSKTRLYKGGGFVIQGTTGNDLFTFGSSTSGAASSYISYSSNGLGEHFRITGDSTGSSGPATYLMGSGGQLQWQSTTRSDSGSTDTFIGRGGAAATLQFGAVDAAAPVAQTLQVQSVVAGTTDTAGSDWTFRASLATGTGASGNIVKKTGFSAKSTGTAQNTAVDRHIIVAKGKVLTSAAAFSIVDIALPTLTMCGGVIEATIVCTDGTDMQSFTQTVTYSAVNKGGVYTTSITASTGDKSVSAGTLTTSWTVVSGTNKVTLKVTPTTSLTPSTNAFLLYYTIKNNSEQATTIL